MLKAERPQWPIIAEEIVKAVTRSRGLFDHDIIGELRFRDIMKARKEAARLMVARGINQGFVARYLQRDHTTVSCYLNPGKRQDKHTRYKERNAANATRQGAGEHQAAAE